MSYASTIGWVHQPTGLVLCPSHMLAGDEDAAGWEAIYPWTLDGTTLRCGQCSERIADR